MGEYPALSDQEIATIARQRAQSEPPSDHLIVNVDQLCAGWGEL